VSESPGGVSELLILWLRIASISAIPLKRGIAKGGLRERQREPKGSWRSTKVIHFINTLFPSKDAGNSSIDADLDEQAATGRD
jgi:hypothetical protein